MTLLTRQQLERIRERANADYIMPAGTAGTQKIPYALPVITTDVHNLLSHIDTLEQSQ